MDNFVGYIVDSLLTTGKQLLLLFGPMFAIAFTMNFLSRTMEGKLTRLFGMKLYLLLFAWLGTTVHESGHALFCIIFRHRINEIRFFHPDPETGTLGYVNHSYNPKSLYQNIGNFFIGIGPIILGAIVIYVATKLLLPNITIAVDFQNSDGLSFSGAFSQAFAVLKRIFTVENFSSWRFYLFVYIALSVGASINLSPPDIKGAAQGFFMIVLALLLLNLSTLWLGNAIDAVYGVCGEFLLLFYAIMLLTILLTLCAALLFPPWGIAKRT